jgi:hypothetical protein
MLGFLYSVGLARFALDLFCEMNFIFQKSNGRIVKFYMERACTLGGANAEISVLMCYVENALYGGNLNPKERNFLLLSIV